MILQKIINGISVGSVYAIIAVGFALIFNIMKFSNFSHGSIMTASAYIGYFLTIQIGKYVSSNSLLFVIALIICMVSGGIIGFIVERMCFWQLREKGSQVIYYFISSITMGIMLENLVNIYAGTNFYSYPFALKSKIIELGIFNIALLDALMLIMSVGFLIILMYVLFRTKIGLTMRAISVDTITAGLMGIKVNQIMIGAFIVAGILAGISGMFLALNYTLYPQLGKMVVKGFIASVIGGLGSITGAVLGALLLGLIEVLLINLVGSAYAPIFTFMIMILFLLLRPRGIAGIPVEEKV